MNKFVDIVNKFVEIVNKIVDIVNKFVDTVNSIILTLRFGRNFIQWMSTEQLDSLPPQILRNDPSVSTFQLEQVLHLFWYTRTKVRSVSKYQKWRNLLCPVLQEFKSILVVFQIDRFAYLLFRIT